MNTLTVVLYWLSQGSNYTGLPKESLARESVYSKPVTGCKSEVRARIYTALHKPGAYEPLCKKEHQTSIPILCQTNSCFKVTTMDSQELALLL